MRMCARSEMGAHRDFTVLADIYCTCGLRCAIRLVDSDSWILSANIKEQIKRTDLVVLLTYLSVCAFSKDQDPYFVVVSRWVLG
jgi:hypothetical protein